MTKKPELLLPAGTLKNMRYAYAFGADAVYAGQPRYSLRARNNDFTYENIETGINEAHEQGKKFFLASNVIPHNSKIKTYLDDIAPIIDLQPDALIMADPGLIMMVKEHWPETTIHLSVQANTVNYAAVKFWQSAGVERVILSRELSLDEIEEIRQQCPDMELEVFVHGALCIAYSGRCLLSGYFNHRDPNQGTCTNACRWEYKVHDAEENITGDIEKIQPEPQKINFDPFAAMNSPEAFPDDSKMQRHPEADKTYLIEEAERPGEYMPILEDENGTYIMNSKDLRALEHVERLMQIGVDSLKIEGRTKSHYYAARTAQVYRQAIDSLARGEAFDMELYADLNSLANRGYTDGFYQRHHTHDYQNYMDNHSRSKSQQFVGEILDYNASEQTALVDVKNRFAVGDTLELILPEGNKTFTLEAITSKKGEAMNVAPGSGHIVTIPLPFKADNFSLIARNF
ncbi:MAG: tRNA 5-hydroxyuridine modification protein YegQ [gamma proteobacterium symbiont of Bathyaustriella thionipta]|nr:tRNA 5-hydroxyuridine modification protein YegQ [gamma proteobacterium symbiont of Bathyaustriella thionipta]MCU7950937.1 tRNA 5-hydroxyuridine modification protein YegQ [gamma proteobacterium symbiont of Bathyaustriella thionipta]MCU7953165.1 tRNA 5-hydroxyuridine modification protein YegQ [gamma proteobacterium symbiont of Bathyaustriella thionipta]MCU7957428.1 tRNA 5-hydroxyuridine modification protein YegQ [gamma proteobacterium symbiont of Bathyaustriella thionipta]MCU7968924.1 tRNA 5-h